MSQRAVTTATPQIVIFVVYKSNKGGSRFWKGFYSPYDVTCYAETAKAAKNKLRSLVSLYEQGLKKYGYPKHLTFKKLGDPEDRKVFEIVKKHIAEEIQERIAKKYESYQSRGIAQEHFFLRTPAQVIGHYYHPQLA